MIKAVTLFIFPLLIQTENRRPVETVVHDNILSLFKELINSHLPLVADGTRVGFERCPPGEV